MRLGLDKETLLRRRHTTIAAGMAALLCSVAAPAATAAAQEAPAPPNYTVDEAALPFAALPGTTTEREWGVVDGAGFRIEVPQDWNGELVTYSHGFVSPLQPALGTPIPPLREYFVSQGYAWASSSYSENGYVIQTGIDDTQALIGTFTDLFEAPDRLYATGVSMGGHIVGAMIEQFPDTYAGAAPLCGVMGDEELYDYFLSHAAAAQTLAGVDASLPAPADYLSDVVPAIKAELGYGPEVSLNGTGRQLSAVTEGLTGGERPLFDQAFDFWSDTAAISGLPFLLGVYGGALTGGPASAANDFATNTGTSYQLDDDPAVSDQEEALNAAVPRRAQTGEPPFPTIEGTLGNDTKVLTMHTIGDLFVPFSMQQAYLERAIENDADDRLVQRAIRDVGHCTFSPGEAVQSFADLVAWVEGGPRPAGDDISDPDVVAGRDFGCAFTVGGRPGLPACDSAPRFDRAAGADRIGTAVDLVSSSYDTADTVVIARGDAYADALAGAPLAASLDGPVLLSGRDRLADSVVSEVRRLGATQAYLLGGPQALSNAVLGQLAEAGITRTVRLGGVDRFDTARLIAAEIGGDAAYVVQGSNADPARGWPDAVSVSALAAFQERPILLVQQDSVPASTTAAITALGLDELTIVGGEAAVSAGVATTLDAQVGAVDRLSGDTRYGTSAAVAQAAVQAGMQFDRTLIATGTAFADALVAGPVAAAGGSVLLLVDGDAASVEPTLALLATQRGKVGDVLVVGGQAAVSTTVEASLRARIE